MLFYFYGGIIRSLKERKSKILIFVFNFFFVKSIILLFIIFLTTPFGGIGQKLNVFFSQARFQNPNNQPYIENYLAVRGNSLTYKVNEDGKLQGSVEVTVIIDEGDSIKYLDKYELKSPAFGKNESRTNFIDLQRIALPKGIYNFEIIIADKNGDPELKPLVYQDVIVMNFVEDSVIISDIELIESYSPSEKKSIFTKGNMELIPYSSNYFPEEIENLTFYAEIYNTINKFGKDHAFLTNFYIESQDSDLKLEAYTGFKKQTSVPVSVMLNKFSIKELPSGNYNLVIEVRDRNNFLVSKKKHFFQRSNPNLRTTSENLGSIGIGNTFVISMPLDSLYECIRSLRPISSSSEINYAETQLTIGDLVLTRKYFYHFWQKRNSLEPEKVWLSYNGQVQKVQKEYGTRINRGYETDRGRVYLQYGQPNSVEVVHHAPSSYPYEIWHYYKLNKLTNAKFIFYNPDLVTEEFMLLHSGVPGEPYDAAWHYKLQKRNTTRNNIDNTNAPESFGERALDFYTLPR